MNEKVFNNQYESIDELYELKELRFLSMNNQRMIKELDLSNWPKLFRLHCKDCNELQKVKNISAIETLKQSGEAIFDFSGCHKLNDIEDINQLVDEFKFRDKKIMLPTSAFMFLQNRYNLFKNKEKSNRPKQRYKANKAKALPVLKCQPFAHRHRHRQKGLAKNR